MACTVPDRSPPHRLLRGTFQVKPEQLPTGSAPAPSSWPWTEGDPGDLFTPRNQHSSPPSSSQNHATPPPSPGREAGHPAQAQVDQPAPQAPRRGALRLLWRPPVTAGALTLALPAAAVIVLLAIAHHDSAPVPTPPLVTQISGPAASPVPSAAAPSTTIPLPAPADAAAPSLAPAPASQPATSPGVTQAASATDGAAQPVDAQPGPQLSQHPAAAPPARQASAPAPPWSADQPSRWHWDKTTMCDPSGHCVDHYNPKPATPDEGWASSPPASSATGSSQPWATWQPTPGDPPHHTGP
jgi:hypothetical protein